jgi:hypothetical protein
MMDDLSERGHKWIRYEMICPNPKCPYHRHHYWVEVMTKPEWEMCNICGHSAPFDQFRVGERTVCRR